MFSAGRMKGVPACCAWARYCASTASEFKDALVDSSHETLSARRPFSTAHVPVPTTATPSGTWITSVTPGTRIASAESNEMTLAPNEGGKAITAVSRPGSSTSIV
jgi:hypothetical protein